METVTIHNRRRTYTMEVEPKRTDGSIHIYGGGHSGYKLSIGERHLTLAELVSVVNVYNAHLTSDTKM